MWYTMIFMYSDTLIFNKIESNKKDNFSTYTQKKERNKENHEAGN